MKKVILYFGIILFFIGCNKNDDDTYNYPKCFQNTINNILENEPRTPRSNIKKYIYLNQTVYVTYRNGIADEQFYVMTKDCDIVCEFGGLSGNNTCSDWDSAEFIETIWTDNR